MKINQATLNDLETLANLFDGYRVFYEQPSDIENATAFLKSRLNNSDSVIFIAQDDNGEGLGFTQLYPTFSSIGLKLQWILNDLFVAENTRKMGVASALMQVAEDFAKSSGANGLSLSTAIGNDTAQTMYEKRGWNRVTAFYNYNKSCD